MKNIVTIKKGKITQINNQQSVLNKFAPAELELSDLGASLMDCCI